ncbi:ABC-type transport system substrate-binding protein [Amaricoccus macauensis]|uniref:ABC-type transport system substrate-binding protein n=1 Tax=Amaricoccus macauensis TaxID=57001 RepID=A0A840SF27_9RHOB|nr:ABC transporter substrate-binding protein [Amaricoccus macauensis]MBB5220437.1 ABC-type transport system substrate-binding protein [Amaricoccus macauensis]
MRKTLAALAAGVGLLALASAAAAQTDVKQGGEMIVTYKDDVSTLDPAIGYDWQNWSMIKSLFDGLMDYEPGTTTLTPDLAESFGISPDGTVFTFKLRPGVKFHNGRELVAEDVKYSIERVVRPETQSPGAGFFSTIKGFDELQSGAAAELSGIRVIDPLTVEFTLSQPDATFLHKMALNFSHVVPKEAVEEFGPDFGRHPVGTGAFRLAEWTLGQRVVFERNPDHWKAGVPKLDTISFEIGQEPNVALLRLQRGEVDVLGDGIPPAQFLQVKANPGDARIVEGGQLQTGYVTMNVTMPPFDDVRVRQAVNMAINKDRIVQIINGRAVPANQPLPPSMPGYAKDYEGYPFDPEGAKKLLAEAGHADGFETELFVYNTDPNPRIAQAIQQDLSEIGIKANIQSLAQANVIAAGGEKQGAPMIWSGGMGWIADFPDPSNFYGPILGCGGAVAGGWNWSWYCNEDIEKRAVAADAMVDPAKQAEREAAWSSIFVDIMKDAPWAPIFNEQRFTMHSPRIGGEDALFVDPVHIPIAYDHVWATDVQ